MNVLERIWPKPSDAPVDDWTPGQRQKLRLLIHCNHDTEKAWPIWVRYTRELFARHLLVTGRIGHGDQGAE